MRMLQLALLLLSILLLLAAPVITRAQADTVRPGNGRLQTSLLKPGLKQYLVYFQDPKKATSLRMTLWLRDVRMETRQGTKTFLISQHWYGNDSSSYRSIFSVNSAEDFAPIYHNEQVNDKINACNWGPADVTGADSVTGNARKGYSMKFDAPSLNWNLDIETFEMLPLAEGKSFAIHFFEPGMEAPQYILYKVTGSEEIGLMGGGKVDCWKLATENTFKGRTAVQTFWISKRNHEFLREEDAFSGIYRYKVKLPGLAPGLLDRFTGQ